MSFKSLCITGILVLLGVTMAEKYISQIWIAFYFGVFISIVRDIVVEVTQ